MVPDILVGIKILCNHAPPPPAAGPSHPVFSNPSQSHCDQEFQSQKTQDMSSGTNTRHESVSPHSVAGQSQLIPLNIAQSDYEQALGPKKGSDTSLGPDKDWPSCSFTLRR